MSDEKIERKTIRPSTFDEIIGLDRQKILLQYEILGAIKRNKRLPHFLISSPPGLGKTTIAHILAKSTNGQIHRKLGTDIRKPMDVYDLAVNCKDGDIVFIEEAHGIGRLASTVLLPWMEEGVIIGGRSIANLVTDKAPNVSFIFPTTNAGKLSEALRNRCLNVQIDYYSEDEIQKIIVRAGKIYGKDLSICPEALALLAQSSRGTPRTAVEGRVEPILNIMVVDDLEFNLETVIKYFAVHNINMHGLDESDIRYCEVLYNLTKENGGRPSSFKSLCQATGYSEDVVSNIIESYLIKSGIIRVESRGRLLTKKGYKNIQKEEIMQTDNDGSTNQHVSTAVKTVASATMPTIDKQELRAKYDAGEVKTMQHIATMYGLIYTKAEHRNYIREVLNQIGLTTKQRAGIVPIK